MHALPASPPDDAPATVPCRVLLQDVIPVRRSKLIALCSASISIADVEVQVIGLQVIHRGPAAHQWTLRVPHHRGPNGVAGDLGTQLDPFGDCTKRAIGEPPRRMMRPRSAKSWCARWPSDQSDPPPAREGVA